MKALLPSITTLPILGLLLLVTRVSAAAIVFTNDVNLSPSDYTYDGQDIIISNGVFTVDGPHFFNNLRVANGAKLTHTAAASGNLSVTATATNESYVLFDTSAVMLTNANIILTSVQVRDTNSLVTYSNDVDYVLTPSDIYLLLQRTANSAIPNGDTVLVSYNFQTTTNSGLYLTLTNDFELEPGAMLELDGRGRGGNQGPGLGGSSGYPTGGGAGYGGFGGISSGGGTGGAAYSSAANPTALGSGGGSGSGGIGGAGGGLFRLNCGGNSIINGLISVDGANATNSRAGGGSGGSILITAQTLSGSGVLRARGGAGEPINGGGGGGGRIAVIAVTNSFIGTALVNGGAGWQRGGAGTFYSQTNNSPASVIVDNAGVAGAGTPLDFIAPLTGTLEVRGRAAAVVVNTSSPKTFGGLIVRANSALTTTTTNNAILVLSVTGNALLETDATLSLDAKGFPANSGSGMGISTTVGGGAGHGGYGGSGIIPTGSAAGGNYYGTMTSPALSGSGGRSFGLYPGGPGGGAVRLTVNGSLRCDGRISVDAGAGGGLGGGGSGGSIWLTVGTFSGTGAISANGGAGGSLGNGGGGGAGGRIAVTFNTNVFTGTLTAFGGPGGLPGAAGTVYTKLNSSSYADLKVDNNGLVGTNTVLDQSLNCSLLVTNAAALSTPIKSTMFFSNMVIAPNSSFTLNTGGSTVYLYGNLFVAAGGLLSSDGLGSIGGQGTGQTSANGLGSGGGGYGGYGGKGAGANGGNAYDFTYMPSASGSSGGGLPNLGGGGGGSLVINCVGLCRIDGRLSANGLNTSSNSNGGGSGGSINLALNQFTGSGLISADGGNGHLPNGGGGGGGRIAIQWTSNTFTGNYSAKGGLGYNSGGAGTIYLKNNFVTGSTSDLIVDNSGIPNSNTATWLDLNSLSNLFVGSGTTLTSSLSSFTLSGNLNIQTNATLLAGGTFTISGNATIAAGGWLSADGRGGSTSGNGQSSSTGSSGGGHGGYGGRGAAFANGGNYYDSVSNPTQAGSSGGGTTPPYGGVGGGFIRLNVSGMLQLDGRISATGTGSLSTNSGGGSGGTVYLSANRLTGIGSLSANGGPGASGTGGGGGGGRVAIYYSSNSFTGTLSAKGGPGFQAGAAGTIYLKNNFSPTPDLIVDNGGLSGTNTMLDLNSLSNLTITGGAKLKSAIAGLTLNLVNLTIDTNCALITSDIVASSGLTLNITGAGNISAGGSLIADGNGNGTSYGQGSSNGSGGGGHAGFGGRGAGASGGNTYDSLSTPTNLGSGGGGTSLNGNSGGGSIRVNAMGNTPFLLNGTISANGLNAYSNNAGGGAGGSLWLSFNRLIGTGNITADGGSGHLPSGGGGGGGRISLSYNFITSGNTNTNGFLGTFSAKGGNGYQRGGAGTFYLRTNNASIAVVFVDNGGSRGAATSVSGSSSYDLFVQGGGGANSIGSPRDVFVRSNSAIVQMPSVSIQRNATFDAGGGINLDGLGSATIGNGTTSGSPKGGAGHGGYGALNSGNFGAVYDSAISPNLSGSQGGNGSGSSGFAPFGGLGGGAVQLTVGNTLLVNGKISADGLNGDINSGGGSGGGLRIQAITFAGAGEISARGGNGQGSAGGGGGGRIAIYSTSNLFTGTLSACGGSGTLAGGAGTIFLSNSITNTTLLLDNCGQLGTNTPITASGIATNIFISNGAIAEFQGAIPLFSNLIIGANSFATTRASDPNLYLALLGELNIASGGGIIVDGKGDAQSLGAGAGYSLSYQGSGGGYGGAGGASASGALGGVSFGSITQPVDRGSGGGAGSGVPYGGSEGGGAVRIAARRVIVDGAISANGKDGIQDDSGGGSGGSVLISTDTFSGTGNISAAGGNGDLYGGGGGGGGRIAVYAPTNDYAGIYSATAGGGAWTGSTGTVYLANSLLGFTVVAQTPIGIHSSVVTQMSLDFNDPIDPASITPNDINLFTPTGLIPGGNLSFSLPTPTKLQINFPVQNTPGDYRLELGTSIRSLVFAALSQVYTGSFTLALPLISGTVTDTNNQPVAGVTVQADLGATSLTDANGNYSLGVSQGWSGAVTPNFGSTYFAPGRRTYSGVTNNLVGENYVMIPDIAPVLSSSLSGTNLFIRWPGYTDITYQLWSSTNLLNWLPVGSPISGSNGVMELLVPTTEKPTEFLRVRASN